MKHVHLIGICGTAMAGVAKLFTELGWKITGSDKGIYPPMSDFLKENNIDFYVGFHPEKIGSPNLVIVGNFISKSNPEYKFVLENKIPYKSYPEALAEFLIKKESIVVAGTYGKTLNTALLTWIWEQAGLNPSYMIAGLPNNFSSGIKKANSEWSIVEGDEYPASRWEQIPKFLYYNPKYLLLTGAQWDHIDIYPKQEDYLESYKKLISKIPEKGIIVAAIDRPNIKEVISESEKDKDIEIITYGRKEKGDYDWSLEINGRNNGTTSLTLYNQNESIGPVTTALLGDENLDHLAGCAALARKFNISTSIITKALETFKGVKRRLDIRSVENGISIIDDFGHSPAKASASLNAVKLSYPKAKIIAVYEPNIGSRVISAIPSHQNSFDKTDTLIIPRLSPTKTKPDQEKRIDGEELTETIKKHSDNKLNVQYIPDDNELVRSIASQAKTGDVVIFLGSHSFRGMINQTIEAIRNSTP